MARDDNRTRPRDKFGKPGVDSPTGDINYVIVEREYTGAQEKTLTPPYTALEGKPTVLLTFQEDTKGDNTDKVFTERYETLPGPWLPFTRYDLQLGPIQGRRRAVRAGTWVDGAFVADPTLIASLTATAKTTYEARDGSVLVSWQIEETNSDGTGSAGNPAYPIQVTDAYDNDRGPVEITTQVVVAAGSEAGSVTYSTPNITEIRYEPINQFLLKKVIEKWNIDTAPALIRYDVDDETQLPVTITTQFVTKPSAGTVAGWNAAGTQANYLPTNDVYGRKVLMSIGSATPTGRTETAWQHFNFPALVYDISATAIEALDGTVRVEADWQHIGARNLPALHQHVITYAADDSLTLPALEYDPVFQDLDRNGFFLNPPRMQRVLCNAISASFNTASDNPKWGYKAETLSFAASSPTATQYAGTVFGDGSGYVGKYKIVAAAKKPWKYNLWRMVVTKVKMR